MSEKLAHSHLVDSPPYSLHKVTAEFSQAHLALISNLSGWSRHVRVCNEASPCFWCRCCGCLRCCCSCWISIQQGGTIALKRGWRFSNCVRVCSVDRTAVVSGWSTSNDTDNDAEKQPVQQTTAKNK